MITDIVLAVISFFGIVTGILIGRKTYEELKLGEKYFVMFKNAVLALLAAFLVFGIEKISLSYIIFMAAGFLIAYLLRYNYLYLGLSCATSIAAGMQLTVMPLVYAYGIPFGTVRYYHIKNNLKLVKIILVNFILFMLPLLVLLFDFDAGMLMAFSAGTLAASIR